MMTKRAIGGLLLLTVAVTLSYSLGYEHGRSSTRDRLNAVSSLRQIGLGFREGRNDISRFSITGELHVPKSQTTNER